MSLGRLQAANYSSPESSPRLKPTTRMVSFLLCLHLAHLAPARADENDLYARIAAANTAFAEGRFDEALSVYESAVEALGDSRALEYNRAAAKYKLGQHAEAAELFSRAAMSPDADLSRRARFGWGNSDYASALATLQSADPEAGQQPDFHGGIEKLKSAIRHYRDVLASAGELPPDRPGDQAARENIERAQRLIDAIEEFLEQQPQQQQQQSQDQQEQQEQDEQQQQEQQQGQEGDEQQQQQSEEQQQAEQEQQQQSQQQDEQQEQPAEQEAQQQDQQPPQQQEQAQQQQARQLEEREMTPEEVEALLQAVRDKEKKRREEQVKRARAQRARVVRDW
jgi:tetratricopeptide (TPR) repeat protein